MIVRLVLLFQVVLAIFPGASWACKGEPETAAPGVEILLKCHKEWVKGKRLGLITNASGVDRARRSSIDLLFEDRELKLVALFAPEHGIRSDQNAGQDVENGVDSKTGLPIFSLYGKTKRPTPEMLARIDVLLYDIQDIGARSFTYVSTLSYSLEEALKAGKEFVVLDRPDPILNQRLDGPVIVPPLFSFVGADPFSWVYHMTPGEFARWIYNAKRLQGVLRVAQVAGWRHGMGFEQLGFPWIPPSPGIPRPESALFYAITGAIGELGVLSEGYGTSLPFELVGAPFVTSSEELARALNALALPGIVFSPYSFRPNSGIFGGQFCRGARIHILDPGQVEPSRTMIGILRTVTRLQGVLLFSDKDYLKTPPQNEKEEREFLFDKVLGDPLFRRDFLAGADADTLLGRWARGREIFEREREQALLYPLSR